MGMVNVQEQDAGKDDYNSYISLQHHIVCLVKEDLHVYGIIFGVGIFMTIFKCNS